MNEVERSFSPGYESRRLMGRILMAVIFAEAIWGLIVSLVDNLIAPWLGQLMGQGAGLPLSFTRNYDYPDVFLSLLEACLAGIVAIAVNAWFQRKPKMVRARAVTSAVPPRAVPAQAPAPPANPPSVAREEPIPRAPTPPQRNPGAVVAAPMPVSSPVPLQTAPPLAEPATPVLTAAPKSDPVKPKKSKNVYYNLVGEPVSDDED